MRDREGRGGAALEEARLILTTVDDAQAAERLACGLVAERLAACVQVSSPVVSHYRWQGKQEQSRELRLEIKLLPATLDAALDWLAAHHPYDTPELIVLPVQAARRYADWMKLELAAGGQ
ncbi:MAG: divalent-cation tolerance protein CutA [Zetaproteobacteria bacterium]|nr:MAG: divalent-cation tolerance protein CutA [Zetaproteobacteria bacterium]